MWPPLLKNYQRRKCSGSVEKSNRLMQVTIVNSCPRAKKSLELAATSETAYIILDLTQLPSSIFKKPLSGCT
jgi:hypothetical protein